MSTIFEKAHIRLGWLLVLLYLVSGATSVAYEVLWIRMLSMQFGVSIFGVVITVAAFMIGLGLGSIFGIHLARRVSSALKTFALLEIAVALFAFTMPWIFHTMDTWFASVASATELGRWYTLQLGMALLVLSVPATAMGLGFPLILKAIQETPVTLAKLYGMNALGAAVGALVPLILLPNLGWLAAMQAIALTGIAVGVAALLLSRQTSGNAGIPAEEAEKGRPSLPVLTIIAYAGVGAAALLLEIGWTRLFGMIMLRTEYVLALILAFYLLGIGFGSLLAHHLKRELWFSLLPVVASLFTLLGLWFVPVVSAWLETTQFDSLLSAFMYQGGVLALFTLPVTLVLGAWLPLLAKRFLKPMDSGAFLYGANSLGAAAGTLLAGFVLLPTLGSYGTVCLGAFLLFFSALAWSNLPRAPWALIVLIVVAIPVFQMPPVSLLLPQQFSGSSLLFSHEDAVSNTQVIEQEDGQRVLLADLHRMDASSDPTAVMSQKNQSRLPLLLHPNPESVLYLGLGTGISAAGSLAFPNLKRTAVELSQGAILAAGEWFTPVNQNIVDQITIVRDDARHFLQSDDSHYDVIIGDLFHPDMVGRGLLLSVQQFNRVRTHLSADGLYVQWLALNQFDNNSLDIVLRSFKRVFPEAVIFIDAYRMALVGSLEPFAGAPSVLANHQRLSSVAQVAATGGEGIWTWLGRYWGKINVGAGPVQHEWAPQIEFLLPGARYNGELDLAKLMHRLLDRRPPMGVAVAALNIPPDQTDIFEAAYAAVELGHQSWLAYLQDKKQQGQRLLQLAYQANPADRWIGFAVADGAMASLAESPQLDITQREALLAVLKVRPDHVEALRRLWQLEASEGNQETAESYRRKLLLLSPLDRAASAWDP